MAFRGRVALVTGGGSGIGRLAARRLAGQGAQVAAFDVDADGLRQSAEGAPGIHGYRVDVTRTDELEAAVRRVESELGPVDRVLAGAGIMPLGRLLDQEADTIHRVMQINYGGVVNTARAALPGMLERGRGDFVVLASMAGWVPTLYMGAYDASKFAVVAFCEVLYHENRGRGVRFACVCPPAVDTPLLEQGRATVWPKVFDARPLLEAETVLDAIETALERNRFWVFPGRSTRLAWRLRRLFPGWIWRRVHRAEGC